MKYNVNKTIKGDWVEYNDARVLIRPIPFTVFNTEELLDMDNDYMYKMFDYALVKWEGLVDEDDKELNCNQKNKKFLFEYDTTLRNLVYAVSRKQLTQEGEDAKK